MQVHRGVAKSGEEERVSCRFRTDYGGVRFWSGGENHCTLPGCTNATVVLPGGPAETTVTIDYDALLGEGLLTPPRSGRRSPLTTNHASP